MRKVYQRNKIAETETQTARVNITTYEYAACVECGEIVTDDEGENISFLSFQFKSDKRQSCKHCDAQLWSLKRPGKPKNQEMTLHKEMCMIPTIGPKTADKLMTAFGSDVIASMLGDKVYDFINLMNEQGELVFSDRQAKRMERGLAKQVFSFGQGGYQASEFIKRYLPDGFFDLLLVDEGMSIKTQVQHKVRRWVFLRLKRVKAFY